MYIKARYQFPDNLRRSLQAWQAATQGQGPFPTLFGRVVYQRTYARGDETWPATVERVVSGVMSVYLDHQQKRGQVVDQLYLDRQARRLAEAIYRMEFLPAGRGLWAMGTELVYQRGSAFLYNCAARWVREPCEDFAWIMDMLMCGCGVGIRIDRLRVVARRPSTQFNDRCERGAGSSDCQRPVFQVPDNRQGWVEALYKLLNAYVPDRHGQYGQWYNYDFSRIRTKGTPLKHFGGTASGPGPLRELLTMVEDTLGKYADGTISSVRFAADVSNFIGVCVVSGNIRRSSEILLCGVDSPHVDEFLNLKNYQRYPERSGYGWLSNNSLVLDQNCDFERYLPIIAERIGREGEPGFINLQNIQKYGRLGERCVDKADLCNPCGEICLEHSEVCNLVEVMLPRLITNGKLNVDRYLEVLELAHFYAKTTSLIPTHHQSTNTVVERNRRLGVSLSGITQAVSRTGLTAFISALKRGYRHLQACDTLLSNQLGVNPSIRLTTVKPSGTISQLAGVTPGIHFPIARYFIRRMRESVNTNLARALMKAGIPFEPSYYRAVVGYNGTQVVGVNTTLDDPCVIDDWRSLPLSDPTRLTHTNYVVLGTSVEGGIDLTSQSFRRYQAVVYRPETLVFEFVGCFEGVRTVREVSPWEQVMLVDLLQQEWADNMVSCTVSFRRDFQRELEPLLAMFAPRTKSVSLLPLDDHHYEQLPYEEITKDEYLRRLAVLEQSMKQVGVLTNEHTNTTELFCTSDVCTR